MMAHFDLQLLHTLVVIAETGSLSAAAPRLFRSQSAVSEQIRKLEDACGQALLIRGKSGARLTPAGERLVEHARRILALSDAAYRDMQGTQLTGQLRLAITDYFRPAALPAILRRLRDEFPRLQLNVSILKSARIEDEADTGAFDIGLSMTIMGDARSTRAGSQGGIPLRREPLRWIAQERFALPKDRELPLLVLPATCALQRFITRSLNDRAIPYTIAHSASGIGGLHLALSAGLGVSCLNESAIPGGMRTLAGPPALPALPDVEFNLLPPRAGEAAFVAEARDMLIEQLR